MPIFHSLILGLVEGFTEFLPISSTAHLTLTSHILGLEQSAFVKSFEIAIQSGAMLAVIVLFWRKFLDAQILRKVITAFVPTAIIGFVLYKLIKDYLLGNITVILWALAIGGVLFIIFEKLFYRKNGSVVLKEEVITVASSDGSVLLKSEQETIQVETSPESEIRNLSYRKTVIIGLAQALAVIPGVSRSAATIFGGLFLGMSRVAVVEFSFLLAVPTILAATGYDLLKNSNVFTADQTGSLIIGFVAAFVTALVGIKFLLSYVKKSTFVGFGVYRIVLAVLFFLLFV